ncbi:hypothetical protein Tco_1116771 [Tanacetum coccineum]
MFHDQGSNKEDPWRQQQVIEGCRDKEKKGFHVLVFQTEAGFLDRQQESIKEFLRILEVHAYRLFVYGSDVRDFMMSMKKHDVIRDEYS